MGAKPPVPTRYQRLTAPLAVAVDVLDLKSLKPTPKHRTPGTHPNPQITRATELRDDNRQASMQRIGRG